MRPSQEIPRCCMYSVGRSSNISRSIWSEEESSKQPVASSQNDYEVVCVTYLPHGSRCAEEAACAGCVSAGGRARRRESEAGGRQDSRGCGVENWRAGDSYGFRPGSQTADGDWRVSERSL